MSQVGNPQFEKKAVLFWVGCSILLVGHTKVGLKFHKGLHCTHKNTKNLYCVL